ncbi:MAG: DUF4065 domain-containing protein [Candidatus Kaiserbacteria bacterium]|nr:DUF4065 domain-containing protein [Candidatus Kaiserbacteria bacterium]
MSQHTWRSLHRKSLSATVRSVRITNLKLQKVLYFAQAYYLAKFKRPLFSNKIEAWEYGPVVPKVYEDYKKHKSNPIISEKDASSLSDKDKEIVKNIWDAFGGYSAGRLVDITHAHTPWKEAYQRKRNTIFQKSLKEYYTPIFV